MFKQDNGGSYESVNYKNWATSFKKMAQNGDDNLLETIETNWDNE